MKNIKLEVLTPDHKYWNAFSSRLEDMVNQTSGCNGYTHTIKILRSLPNIDVEGSIDYFKEHGGYCDCEIIMNVTETWLDII